MTHDEALAHAERMRESDSTATWIVTEHDGQWTVARVGIATQRPTGTATKPPPTAPRDDPHSPAERAAWFAAGG